MRFMLIAAALLTAAPAVAHQDDDDWKERHYRHAPEMKGKGKRNGRRQDRDRGYYIIYVPLYPPQAADAPAPRQALPPPAATPPRNFPRESQEQRARAGDRQREILERELAAEQELLELARRELAEQEARLAPDHSDRSILRRYRENMELHEGNVASLRRELSRLGK